MTNTYLRIYPDQHSLLLISNSSECMTVAIEVLGRQAEVREIEIDDLMDSDYTAPGDPAAAGEEPSHQLFKYRVLLHDGRLHGAVAAHLRAIFTERHLVCTVTEM